MTTSFVLLHLEIRLEPPQFFRSRTFDTCQEVLKNLDLNVQWINELQVRGHWSDCIRETCCPKYTFVAGRCIPEDLDPCSLNLCEQKCSVYFGRVICTCFAGFKFNQTLYKLHAAAARGGGGQSTTGDVIAKACQDVDECMDLNAGCQQARKLYSK